MWVIPENLKQSFPSAQGFVGSKEGLKELLQSLESQNQELSLMWRSKPSLSRTWLQAWKRVFWIPQLFGRMLRHSTQSRFGEEYAASLEDILVSPGRSLGKGKVLKTQDTYGRIYSGMLEQSSLFGAFLRTSEGISPSASSRSSKTYDQLVIMLRQESSLRRKRARLMRESGSLSSQSWPTPRHNEKDQGLKSWDHGDRGPTLTTTVNWRTPTSQESGISTDKLEGEMGSRMYNKETGRNAQYGLSQQINWGTPRVSTNGMNGSDREDPNSRIEDQVMKETWSTPMARDRKNPTLNAAERKARSGWNVDLNDQVVTTELWSTPNVVTREGDQTPGSQLSLDKQVAGWNKDGTNWATPRLSEYKGVGQKGSASQVDMLDRGKLIAQVEQTDGQQSQGSSNTDGKSHGQSRGRLNPAWVLQLLGTTLEKTFFVPLATQWWSR